MVVPERSDSGATPFRTFDIGWLVGFDGGCPSGALRSDTFPNFQLRAVGGVSGGWPERSDLVQISGWWSGVTAALPERWKKPKGGKAPAAYLRGSFSRTTTLRPRTTTAMRTTAPRSRRGARPARQESAHGFNPKRRRACLCGGDSEEAGTSKAFAGRGGNDKGAKHDAL